MRSTGNLVDTALFVGITDKLVVTVLSVETTGKLGVTVLTVRFTDKLIVLVVAFMARHLYIPVSLRSKFFIVRDGV